MASMAYSRTQGISISERKKIKWFEKVHTDVLYIWNRVITELQNSRVSIETNVSYFNYEEAAFNIEILC